MSFRVHLQMMALATGRFVKATLLSARITVMPPGMQIADYTAGTQE
jgi:hypothetical protein